MAHVSRKIGNTSAQSPRPAAAVPTVRAPGQCSRVEWAASHATHLHHGHELVSPVRAGRRGSPTTTAVAADRRHQALTAAGPSGAATTGPHLPCRAQLHRRWRWIHCSVSNCLGTWRSNADSVNCDWPMHVLSQFSSGNEDFAHSSLARCFTCHEASSELKSPIRRVTIRVSLIINLLNDQLNLLSRWSWLQPQNSVYHQLWLQHDVVR